MDFFLINQVSMDRYSIFPTKIIVFDFVASSVEKRIIREQSRNTKEEKLRTRTHKFYVENPQGEENPRPLPKQFSLILKVRLHTELYWRLSIYIYINKLINPKP
jgi:hypothetical protein